MAAALLAAISLAGADGQGKGPKEKQKHRDSRPRASVSVFLDADRRVIREWVAGYPGGLPPGLAKRGGDLPPGLEKQLRRNGRLPPGLEKKLYLFPPELEARLSPLEPGLRRAFLAGHAVVYDAKTSVILDVFIPL